MSEARPQLDLPLQRLQWISLAVGLTAAALCVVGWFISSQQFFQSYLFGFLYWWVVSMGCLGLALLYQMTGGNWGYAARPFFDSGIRVLPLVMLAFVPVALGLEHIYVWTEPGFFAESEHGHNQSIYLTPFFFIGRGAAYLVACLLLGFLLTAGVVKNGRMVTRLWPMVGGLGAVLLLHVVTFAAFDWAMTLEPSYYSTLYGGLYCAGAMLCGMCLVVAGVALSLGRTGQQDEASLTVLHDVSKLLLAMVMVWAYLNFSQFLITYSGNLPLTAAWYVRRLENGWQWLAVLLVVLHFVLPFALLLSRDLKRNPAKVAMLAIGLAAAHALHLFWMIAPAFHQEQFHLHWLDVAAVLAVGGLWMSEFFRQLKHRLLPVLAHWPYPDATHG